MICAINNIVDFSIFIQYLTNLKEQVIEKQVDIVNNWNSWLKTKLIAKCYKFIEI